MAGQQPIIDPLQRAFALRETQQMEAAYAAIVEAAQLSPADPRAAFGLAQISFECWRPAAELFDRARGLIPDNPDIIRNHALALVAEGQGDAAEQMLRNMLDRHPAWLDGHRTLAAMRLTSGVGLGFDESYARACQAEPGNASIRLAWFHQHAIRKDWKAAQSVLDQGDGAMQASTGFQMARLFLGAESGDPDFDGNGFTVYAEKADPGLDLCRVRYHLRCDEVELAQAIAARQVVGQQGRSFWPYLSLCWRVLGDNRADWLDRPSVFNRHYDLDFSAEELTELAAVLRSLHRMKAPYPEQSVRGGTQTDRQLIFHPHPAIQAARAKFTAAVEDYIQALPDIEPSHPLASGNRANIAFEGSWSVRLMGAGYHASHTHSLAWLSSAFYVALPDAAEMGIAPAGWLSLGTPPPELNLNLKPYGQIAPVPGRLAIFPSTMWHSTEPFEAGERLTMAFDVRFAF